LGVTWALETTLFDGNYGAGGLQNNLLGSTAKHKLTDFGPFSDADKNKVDIIVFGKKNQIFSGGQK
jgi:hypothetical protein